MGIEMGMMKMDMDEEKLEKTQEINTDDLRAALKARKAYTVSGNTASLLTQRELILLIRGIVERIVLQDNLSILMGRSTARTGNLDKDYTHVIDLGVYEAMQRGVSRQHARLDLRNNQLFITDLGSTNGTWLAGKRLEPNQPTRMKKGDELLLGRMAVQVVFRGSTNPLND